MDSIKLRRDFHRHPEVGFTEFWTASRVVEYLQQFGYRVLYGSEALDPKARRGVPKENELECAYKRALKDGANPRILEKMKGGLTAVIGILEGHLPGPTVAFRFDMDALPVRESDDENHVPFSQEFRSKYEGNMHACAHDGHISIGLNLAERMSREHFSGTLMLIFQPAEEGGRGAYPIIKKGIIDSVDKIYCMHLGLNISLGEIYGGTTGWLASTKLLTHFHGVASHSGAAPEKGRNALLGASTALLNIHSLPRYSTGKTRVNVGVLEGGAAPNIIPSYAKMMIETRSDDSEVNKELVNQVRKIIKHSSEMHRLDHEIETIGESTTINCDEKLVEVAMEEANKADIFATIKKFCSGGASEDASLLIRRVQKNGGLGTYIIVGTTIMAPHHNEKFDIDEKVLPMAGKLLERIAKRELH